MKSFWERAAAEPERVAFIEIDGQEIRADEVLASCNQLVHALRGLGLKRGDSIAAVLPNSLEAFEVYLAIQQAGWYLTPINFHLVGREVEYILHDCEAKVLIAHERFSSACTVALLEMDPAIRPHSFAVGQIESFGSYAELKVGQPTTMPADRSVGSIMNYTSGTTGRPKGVRRALLEGAPDEVASGRGLASYGVSPDEQDNVHMLACPWYHTAPMLMVGPSLHAGHPVVIIDRFDAENCLALIDRYRVTITHLVPTQFVRLLALPDDVKRKYDVSSLRHIIHGAAPIAPDVKRRMIEWWGPVLVEYYASTEGVGGTLIYSDEWLAKPGSVGKPRPGSELVIMDDEGNILPPGQVGTIYTYNPSRARFQYFKDAEKTQQARRGKYATVGDMGYLDDDGYLYLSDRKADMIISGGVNIYPAEIEHVLITHSKVADVAVFGIPNDEWGEEIKAVVEPAPGVQPSNTLREELVSFLGERLARFKVPRSIDFTDALPRDPNGKLYKRKLREPYWAHRQRAI